MLIEATFTPSGTWWQRLGGALFTAYVNVHLRIAEQQDGELFAQIERLLS